MRYFRGVWVVGFAMCVAVTAVAAPVRGERQRGGQAAQEDAPRLRERIGAKVKEYLARELATRLGLNVDQQPQMAQAVGRMLDAQQSQVQISRASRQELKRALREGNDSDITAAVARLRTQQPTRTAVQVLLDETQGFLSSRQQAELVIVLPEVRRAMRQKLKEKLGDMRQLRGE